MNVVHLSVLQDDINDVLIDLFLLFNPFQSNFSANRILLSSYLFWAGKRLVDYL
jgi:hypothetical protein